jgi:Na+/phosphate symporter
MKMTKQEVSKGVDSIHNMLSNAYEMLNDTGDYESERLDSASTSVEKAMNQLVLFLHELDK